jgi:Mg-chelatase subunit ChlD
MRLLSIGCLVLATTGCSVKFQARPQAIVHTHIEMQVQAQVRAQAQAQVAVAIDGSATASDGAAIVEFFGIPLDNAREVVFVFDRSGSMAEDAGGRAAGLSYAPGVSMQAKIDVAREELIQALDRLPEGTTLNVIFFSDWLEGYAPQVITIDATTRDSLVDYVKETYPSGSTALIPAMRTAFLMNARRIVLLSDGLGNIGGDSDDLLRDAREAMRGGVRIDTIGLGPDQDTDLMRSLASESGGIYQDLR